MSGGIAYVLDRDDVFPGGFAERCNPELVGLGKIEDDAEAEQVKAMVAEHLTRTGSPVAAELLDDWDAARAALVRVMPTDYERVLAEQAADADADADADAGRESVGV
jgi:glutamate synthase domain-containing protein 3